MLRSVRAADSMGHGAGIRTDLTFQPIAAAPDTLAAIRAIDLAILGFAHVTDQAFLLIDRQAYPYRRGDRVIG